MPKLWRKVSNGKELHEYSYVSANAINNVISGSVAIEFRYTGANE